MNGVAMALIDRKFYNQAVCIVGVVGVSGDFRTDFEIINAGVGDDVLLELRREPLGA